MTQHEEYVYLGDMLDASRDAIQMAVGKSFNDVLNDKVIRYALLHALLVIGEAATNVSKSTQASTTSIPWSDIIGMRHRIVHGYSEVNLERVWDTITIDLPRLALELESLLPSQPSE